MNKTVIQEFLVLFLNLGAGVGIGFLFDCYQTLRQFFRMGYLLTQVADLLFWVLCAALVFGLLFWFTGGEVRFYTLLILPLGMGFYLHYVSPFVQKPLVLAFTQLGYLFRFCFEIVVFYPFYLLWRGGSICLEICVGLLRLFWLPERCLLHFIGLKIREGFRKGWRTFGQRRPPFPPWMEKIFGRIF